MEEKTLSPMSSALLSAGRAVPERIASLTWLALPILFAALVSVGGYLRVPIPGNPVPLTLQVVFVLLAGAYLAPAAAAASMTLFILAGLIGVPVYSGGGSGMTYLIGPTGGYLSGFVAGAALCAWLLRGRRDSLGRTALAMAAATCAIHALGILQLGLFLGGDFKAAIQFDVLPFLPADLVKIAAAAAFVAGSSAVFEPPAGQRLG